MPEALPICPHGRFDTILPVFGVPVESIGAFGQDSLLSDRADAGWHSRWNIGNRQGWRDQNAALLAAQVLALQRPHLARRLKAWRAEQKASVAERPVDQAMTAALAPGATIGIIGGGQLSRMLANGRRAARLSDRYPGAANRTVPPAQVANAHLVCRL